MLALPDALAQEFREELTKYEEKKKMPYVTSIERIGIEKGVKKGALQKSQEDVIEILSVRFKKIPGSLLKTIRSINDAALLSKLHRKAILAESIQSVKQIIKESKN
ncbi:MAG: cytosolic protein, partial [Gammaproteobacteria bacterium]|nr:cytosolic protein [Gammaproteobacteria bacterium]